MIERRTEFIDELNSICEYIVKHGELQYDYDRMKERFLEQSSDTHENIECIENLEYAVVKKNVPYDEKQRKYYGLKIKDTNILLADIAYFLEKAEVRDIISKEYPELSVQKIRAAQRAITLILLSFECDEIGKLYDRDEE